MILKQLAREEGFTLIELMVVAVIVGIIVFPISMLFRNIVQFTTRSQEAMDLKHVSRYIMSNRQTGIKNNLLKAIHLIELDDEGADGVARAIMFIAVDETDSDNLIRIRYEYNEAENSILFWESQLDAADIGNFFFDENESRIREDQIEDYNFPNDWGAVSSEFPLATGLVADLRFARIEATGLTEKNRVEVIIDLESDHLGADYREEYSPRSTIVPQLQIFDFRE